MMKSLYAELDKKGQQIVNDLKQGIKDRKLSATGELIKSIEHKVEETNNGYTLTILANDYIYTLVPNGPKPSSSGSLKSGIKKWVESKPSVVPADLTPSTFAYLVTRKIAQEGTLFNRKGPNKYNDGRLLDEVINQELIDSISEQQLEITKLQVIYGTN